MSMAAWVPLLYSAYLTRLELSLELVADGVKGTVASMVDAFVFA